jgi:hypothetical protein
LRCAPRSGQAEKPYEAAAVSLLAAAFFVSGFDSDFDSDFVSDFSVAAEEAGPSDSVFVSAWSESEPALFLPLLSVT